MLCFPFFFVQGLRSPPPPPRARPGLNSLKAQDSRRTEFPRDFGPGGTEFQGGGGGGGGGGGETEFPVTPALKQVNQL